jgi:hypothetical protein
MTDEGMYTCRVSNRAGSTLVDFKLIVLEPPKILILDNDKNRTSIDGTSMVISCPATGTPDPSITW